LHASLGRIKQEDTPEQTPSFFAGIVKDVPKLSFFRYKKTPEAPADFAVATTMTQRKFL